ncbi:MAG: hypothetical protein V7608_729, partial [Hyphomicrobiales bacterium]
MRSRLALGVAIVALLAGDTLAQPMQI